MLSSAMMSLMLPMCSLLNALESGCGAPDGADDAAADVAGACQCDGWETADRGLEEGGGVAECDDSKLLLSTLQAQDVRKETRASSRMGAVSVLSALREDAEKASGRDGRGRGGR